MAIVTEKILDKVLDNLETLDEDPLNELVQSYFEKQPFVMAYLMVFTEGMSNENAQNELVYAALVVLECFYSMSSSIPQITEEEIETEEDKQIELMRKIEKMTNPEEQMEIAMSMMSSQMVLLAFITELFVDNGVEDDSFFTEEDSGAAFGSVKLIADLLSNKTDIPGLKKV
jgi:hypothetical protein